MMSPSEIIVYEILTLLIGSLLLAHTGMRLLRLWKNRPNVKSIEWIREFIWLVAVVFVLRLWPNYSYAYDAPVSSFLFLAAIISVLLSITENKNSGWAIVVKQLLQVVFLIGCVCFLYLAFQYELVFRPASLDFFYYINTAHHMVSGAGYLNPICYFYFPGIYQFWRIVLHLTDGSLNSVQWASIIVIAADATLIGAIVFRLIRNFFLSVLSAGWFILLCSRFDGLVGIAEPIATLPILVGLLCWGGRSFLGRAGLFRIIGLGIGIGLGLYTRQHAGFVSLGAISFLITLFVQGKSNPVINFQRLLLLPIISATVLIVGILSEGHGLQPLIIGLLEPQKYSFDLRTRYVDSLWTFGSRLPFLTAFSITGFVIWFLCVIRLRSYIETPWFQMLGFSLLAGIFSLFPYLGQPALHYALFSGAMLIIASCLVIDFIWKKVPQILTKSAPVYFVLIVLCLMQFVEDRKTWPTFYAWPPEKQVIRPNRKLPYMQPDVISDLISMKRYVRPLEEIYVLPPSQNDVHFFLSTTYPTYGWYWPVPIQKAINIPDLTGVIVVKSKAMMAYNFRLARSSFQYDSANEILKQQGFQPVVDLKSITLWRKAE